MSVKQLHFAYAQKHPIKASRRKGCCSFMLSEGLDFNFDLQLIMLSIRFWTLAFALVLSSGSLAWSTSSLDPAEMQRVVWLLVF